MTLQQRSKGVLYFLIVTTYFFTTTCIGQVHKIEQFYTKHSKAPLLITFKDQANLSLSAKLKTKEEKTKFVYEQVIRQHQESLSRFLNSFQINQFTSFPVANSIVVDLNQMQYFQIKKHPLVLSIILDVAEPRLEAVSYRNEITPNQRSLPTTWGIKDCKADSVWMAGYTGKGVVIGGQDTGYNNDLTPLRRSYRGYINDSMVTHHYHWHDAIREQNVLNSNDNNPCGFDTKMPCDDNNHGTHTMGTMVGSDTSEIIGVAPDAQWIGCRNMDRGWGKPSSYIECFEWFLAPTDLNNQNPKPELAPDVINNSWGCPEKEGCNDTNWEVMRRVVVALKAAGIFVVVSAGNSGPNCNTVSDPAAFFKESFTVGA
ncbi:MAG TPA: S8 family serine peptidase, partial [Saprospiraceae bacterium]|nr:S8 family serine peptidase [Saprospiraceae bacterium]